MQLRKIWSWICGDMHCSWHIAWASVGSLVGLAAAARWNTQAAEWLLIGGALAICLVLIVGLWRHRWLALLMFIAGCSLGVGRGTTEHIGLGRYRAYYDRSVTIYGAVVEDPATGKHADRQLHVTGVRLDGRLLPGDVWTSTSSQVIIERGDKIEFTGTLRPGFGSFAASISKAQVTRVVRSHPGDTARALRDWFATGVRRAISEPESALGLGYLTGQRTALPTQLDDQLRLVGLTHAVVASGYNLTILVGFARTALLGVSKYFATLGAAAMIAAFMCITGFSPSMSRAGLVASLSLMAWYYGRTIHPFVLLTFAATCTALIKPAYVWGDLGWYLSFAAFAGVIGLAPLVRAYFWGRDPPGAFWQILTDTLCAQIMTTPIILHAFGALAVYALPANMLVLPFVPLAMLLVFVSGVVSLVIPGLAPVAGAPAEALLKYMIGVIDTVSKWPDAQLEVHWGFAYVAIAYLGIGLVMYALWLVTRHDFRG